MDSQDVMIWMRMEPITGVSKGSSLSCLAATPSASEVRWLEYGCQSRPIGVTKMCLFHLESLVKLPIFSLSQPSEGLQIPFPSRSSLGLRLAACQLHANASCHRGSRGIAKLTSNIILPPLSCFRLSGLGRDRKVHGIHICRH